MHIIITGELPHLNNYTQANRTHYHAGAKVKKQATELVAWQSKKHKPVKGAFKLGFTWYFPNKRVDPDNRIFAKKFILDGLQKAGVIENDNYASFRGILYEDWHIDNKNPRVEIEIQKF